MTDHADATSRPWAIDAAEPCQFGGDLQGSEGEWGEYVGETAEPENAALIVQAVNERDALLAELAVGERERQQLRDAAQSVVAEARIVSESGFVSADSLRALARVLTGEGDATP